MRNKRKLIRGVFAAVLLASVLFTGCTEEEEKQAADAGIIVEKDPQIASDIPVVIQFEEDDAQEAGAGEKDLQDEDTGSAEEEEETEETEEASGDEEATEDEGTEDEETEDEEAGDGEEAADDEGSSEEEKTEEETASGPVTPGSVESVGLNPGWTYADYSAINSGSAKLYRAADSRKGVVIGVNAGHGTSGGASVKTYCHPDMSPKVTGGSTGAGAIKAAAVSGGMSFADGTSEASVALREAQILRDKLLAKGYDVLMLRDDSDVQLDNIARTVIANNTAACLISLHWDGDNLSYDKGCFYISTPDGIKGMDPVASHWQQHEALGRSLIGGLSSNGCKIHGGGSMNIDLTQTSYSTIPSVDIELGNAASAHDDATLSKLADGLVSGITGMF